MGSSDTQAECGTSSSRLFYCPDIPDDAMERAEDGLELPEEEARHIARVLRLQVGDAIRLFDGRGRLFEARLSVVSKQSVTAKLEGLVHLEPPPQQPVMLLVGTPKAKKSDFVVEKSVELGVEKLVFFEAERSVARKAEKHDKTLERWEKLVVAACKQCGRTRLMPVELYDSLSDALECLPADSIRLAFWEEAPPEQANGGQTIAHPESISHRPDGAQNTALLPLIGLIGPEGGLTSEEITSARHAAFSVCSLGTRILRAETAVVVVATLLQQATGTLSIQIENQQVADRRQDNG